jgi:hypothetical protein
MSDIRLGSQKLTNVTDRPSLSLRTEKSLCSYRDDSGDIGDGILNCDPLPEAMRYKSLFLTCNACSKPSAMAGVSGGLDRTSKV